MPWDGGHMGWMGISWIAGLLFLVLLVRWAAMSSGDRPGGGDSPEQILKRRYARGEIERDEYLRRLEELRR